MRRQFLALALAAAGCGGPASSGPPVVTVRAPSLAPSASAPAVTLEPLTTPPPTPVPTPTPAAAQTPGPAAPRGATIQGSGGTQAGSAQRFCWTDRCYPAQPEPSTQLTVRSGETALLRIAADRPPSEETIRPFQTSRSEYPTSKIDPALETELRIDLEPGDWSMDLCATWHGTGQPVCWLFKLKVAS